MICNTMVHKMENVKLLSNHEPLTSQESIEMEEYSDEEDEVFVRGMFKLTEYFCHDIIFYYICDNWYFSH